MTDLELYNKLTGKSVKRFASKADGVRRLEREVKKTRSMRLKYKGKIYLNTEQLFRVYKFDHCKEEKFRFKLYLSKTGKATFAGMRFTRAK